MPSQNDTPPKTPKSWRCHVYYPGLLARTMRERIAELEMGSFSPYIVELVCFNLRKRRRHSISQPIGNHPPAVQDAIDREIVRNYVPGVKRNGEFIMALLRNAEQSVPAKSEADPGSVVKAHDFVRIPIAHRENLKQWIKELGFKNLSAFVTSLIRYDLLLGGPHHYFKGDDCSPEMLEALDRETVREFNENRRPKVLADYLAEAVAGRELTPEERDATLEQAAENLKERALRAKKRF